MKPSPENTGQKQEKGKWVKGQSGNPDGRPKGTKNKTTLMAQALLDGEAEALTRKCIQLALKGRPVALKLCLERILPPKKERTIQIDIQAPGRLEEIVQAMALIVEKVADGTLCPQEGNTLMGMLATTTKVIEAAQVEQRLTAVESALKLRKTS
ncbi:MAG TPA: hypothetical protein DD706_24565 [Nitrospiraceae bacterium]|nr:hypothetical protein [Nitrospiraceae bacterium]